MRIALISDIHGNAVSLRAVLADADAVGVDRIVCLGDVATLGPDPDVAVELVAERCGTVITGNHEDFLLEPGSVHSYTDVVTVLDAIDWCAAELSADHLAVLGTSVPTAAMPLGTASLFAFHGTPRSNRENLLACTPADETDAMLGDRRATVLAGGHTHLPLFRTHGDALLLNPGSVGMPFAEFVNGGRPTLLPCAEYAIVEDRPDGTVRVDLRRVEVPVSDLVRAAARRDYPFARVLLEEYSRF